MKPVRVKSVVAVVAATAAVGADSAADEIAANLAGSQSHLLRGRPFSPENGLLHFWLGNVYNQLNPYGMSGTSPSPRRRDPDARRNALVRPDGLLRDRHSADLRSVLLEVSRRVGATLETRSPHP